MIINSFAFEFKATSKATIGPLDKHCSTTRIQINYSRCFHSNQLDGSTDNSYLIILAVGILIKEGHHLFLL
jgi:hypothetical protein